MKRFPSRMTCRHPPVQGQYSRHLTELCQEFDDAAQDVRQYTGMREAQIQSWQRLCSDILRRMLPVLENIEPFLADEDERVSGLAQVIRGRFLTELTTIGVRLITPEPGEPFNASYHQLHPDTDGLPPYQVKAVAAPGFLFHPRVAGANDVVLKPAEVIAETIVVEEPLDLAEPADLEEAEGMEGTAIADTAQTEVAGEHDALAPSIATPASTPTIAETSANVVEQDVEAEGARASSFAEVETLLIPLHPEDITAEEAVASPAVGEPEPIASSDVPSVEEDDPLNFWLEQDHKIWVVDDEEDAMHGAAEYEKDR